MILVDTNLLLRIADPISADCQPARAALQNLRRQGADFAITPQALYEFWSVATRPTGRPPQGLNGLGWTTHRADLWLGYILRTFMLLSDLPSLPERWRILVRTVTGVKSHDARMVAAMQTYQLTDLLTFNGDDFRRYSFINIMNPRNVT